MPYKCGHYVFADVYVLCVCDTLQYQTVFLRLVYSVVLKLIKINIQGMNK